MTGPDLPQELEQKNIYSPNFVGFFHGDVHPIKIPISKIPKKSPTIRQQKSKVLTQLFYVISIDSMHKILNHLLVLKISFDNWHYEPIIWNYPHPVTVTTKIIPFLVGNPMTLFSVRLKVSIIQFPRGAPPPWRSSLRRAPLTFLLVLGKWAEREKTTKNGGTNKTQHVVLHLGYVFLYPRLQTTFWVQCYNLQIFGGPWFWYIIHIMI